MATELTMSEADLDSVVVREFLADHLEEMEPSVPAESQHALGFDDFVQPGVRLWAGYLDGRLAGTVALRRLSGREVEIKTMRLAPEFRGRGLSRTLLDFVLDTARDDGEEAVFLETGAADMFLAARALYESAGFVRCGPYGSFTEDANSVFMRLDLAPSAQT